MVQYVVIQFNWFPYIFKSSFIPLTYAFDILAIQGIISDDHDEVREALRTGVEIHNKVVEACPY